MSFNQYRTNPSQAVSNFKGRTETSKAWPGTAVSTWMNGGLFGSAVNPKWEVLSTFAPSSSTQIFEFDVSAYKADWAALKVSWIGMLTPAQYQWPYVSVGRYSGSTVRSYGGERGVIKGTPYLGKQYGGTRAYKLHRNVSQYSFLQGGEYEFWGLDDSTDQLAYGGNSFFGYGMTGNGGKDQYGWNAGTNGTGTWDRFKIALVNLSNIAGSGRWAQANSRITIWGLKAQRTALA